MRGAGGQAEGCRARLCGRTGAARGSVGAARRPYVVRPFVVIGAGHKLWSGDCAATDECRVDVCAVQLRP